MAPAPERVRGVTRKRVMHGLFALIVLSVGVWLIVTSRHDQTERVTAVVSASHLSGVNRAEEVSFVFEDGSKDDVVSPTADGFFDAVAKFGPSSAQVTRNTANHSIYKVKFRGKTYTLNSAGGDIAGGIIAVVLGLLGLIYVVFTGRGERGQVAGDVESGRSQRQDR